jgi:NAD(P)-dependent dehydrogenase (short-subunit alcohol dehydrogenase family)
MLLYKQGGIHMKTVVITGSARGFGLAMHRLFRERGCNIVVNDISNEALENAKKELENISGTGEIICIQGDITKSEDIQSKESTFHLPM